jgi:hypothetical protein
LKALTVEPNRGLDEKDSFKNKMAKPKKIEITIQTKNYDPSYKNGMSYTSVDFMASIYGAAFPCDTEEQVKDAIRHFKEWIIEEGDIPIVKDLRNSQNLIQQTLFNESNGTLKQLKGGLEIEMENKIEEYANLLAKIKSKIQDSNEAVAIMEQIGKDRRTELIQSSQNSVAVSPATEKQRNYLKSLGIEFDESISKKEASDLIQQSKE